MARPRDVSGDIAAAQSAGIDTIVSLLEPAEAAKFNLKDEAEICAGFGITFLNHPIRDMHLPDPDSFAAFTADLADRLIHGANIAVHCYASIGRSGMLTCSILGHFGFDAEMALQHVSAKRGVPVPDTPEQAAFIRTSIAALIARTTQPKTSS
jgi:protein-tyrosine phosphatase